MSLYFERIDEVYCRVRGSVAEVRSLADELTFEVPGANFSPKHVSRGGTWDGYIRLLNAYTGRMYAGLIEHASQIARGLEIEVEIDPQYDSDPFSVSEAEEFIRNLNAPFNPHDFQQEAFIKAIRNRRALFLSPTSSGKSFMIYLISAYLGLKTLIVCPTTNLVKQMIKDIKSYGYVNDILMVMQGTEKSGEQLITVSTWQSINKLSEKYFQQYEVIIGDEVHRFAAKSLVDMMTKTSSTKYRFGFTGSLDESKSNELTLIGLFGPTHTTATTKELIDRGIVSDITIKVIVFSYPKHVTQQLQKDLAALDPRQRFNAETEFVLGYEPRNRFIKNLINSLDGNSITLFRRVEAHGDILYDMLKDGPKNVIYIHGKVKERDVSDVVENSEDNAVLASDGTFSTGVSINNIQHVLKGNPIKSVVNNKQSIGRGLRKDGKANHVIFYDLADDLTVDKRSKRNYLYNHLIARLKIYAAEGHKFKIYNVALG